MSAENMDLLESIIKSLFIHANRISILDEHMQHRGLLYNNEVHSDEYLGRLNIKKILDGLATNILKIESDIEGIAVKLIISKDDLFIIRSDNTEDVVFHIKKKKTNK